MNIKFVNITILLLMVGVLILFPFSSGVAQDAPIWPIRSNIENWDRVNCTFGEIHGGGSHFHGAIDIDQNPHDSASVVQSGIVRGDFIYADGVGVTVVHEYPPASGNFNRRTRYLHLQNDNNLPSQEDIMGTGDSIGLMGNHLHLEMHEFINGEWVRLDPLDKDYEWNLRYHQHLQGRPDIYDPVVNDIYVAAKTGCTGPIVEGEERCPKENSVVSGCWFDEDTAIGLSRRTANNVSYCRAHLANTQFSNFSVGPVVQSPDDQLVVFGNIGLIANVRDIGINSQPGGENTSSGQGATIRRFQYGIENQSDDIYVPIKYDVHFRQLNNSDKESIDQIFNPYFDPAHLIYGNNDFIELRSGDDEYLSPYPHPLINDIQSNGIWSTKARGDTEHIFRYTPDNTQVARCPIGQIAEDSTSPEAKYPDGEYTLRFRAEDDWGRINRNNSGRDVTAKLTVIVDNFKPFAHKVSIASGEGNEIYSSAWNWAGSRLVLIQEPAVPQDRIALKDQPLWITVTTSEPMRFETDEAGIITESVQIKLHTEGAANAPWQEWLRPETVSEDRLPWTGRDDAVRRNT